MPRASSDADTRISSWPVKLPTGSTACQTSMHFTYSSDSPPCTTTMIWKPRERQLYSIQTRTRHTLALRQPKPEYTQKIYDNEKNKILLQATIQMSLTDVCESKFTKPKLIIKRDVWHACISCIWGTKVGGGHKSEDSLGLHKKTLSQNNMQTN